ncbi:unnamed protein product, partial [Hapterophycus canaliculatus]
GEYYDLPSDKFNHYAGPLTGGSKVLLSGEITTGQCFALGYAAVAAAAGILAFVLPRRCLAVGAGLLFIAHQYSATPMQFNHRGLGELSASLASNVLLPQFAALLQSDFFEAPAATLWLFHSSLAFLVVTSFCLKMSMFLALNMADRRADWLGSKYTIPVIYGEETSSRLFALFMVVGYVSVVCIYFMGLCPVTTLVAILVGAPEAMSISRAFNPSLTLKQLLLGSGDASSSGASSEKHSGRRPYALDSLVARVLKHGPGLVLATCADTMLREASMAGKAAVAAAAADGDVDGGGFLGSYWGSWLSGAAGMFISTSFLVRCLPLVPFIYLFILKSPRKSPPPPSTESESESSSASKAARPEEAKERARVVVAGGGVAGLVLGACLQEIGLPFEILEKNPNGEDIDGADIALWPAATKVLKELGVGSTESTESDGLVDLSDFWGRKTYPVRSVRICKVEKGEKTTSPQDPVTLPASGSSKGNGVSGLAAAAKQAVLTKVDMDTVVDDEGEPFRLVGRKAVMSALVSLVEKDRIRRGVRVVKAQQSIPPGEMIATAHIARTTGGAGDEAERLDCRVLVGADGIHSVCREEVSKSVAMLNVFRDESGNVHSINSGGPAAAGSAVPAVRAADARDGGEICYRGVLDLREGSPAAAAGLRAMFEEDEERRPSSMSVVYGERMRFSWGYLDKSRETGYWFVKQLTGGKGQDSQPLGQGWPEPLRTLVELTGEDNTYAHRIQDRPPLYRWSCCNITLLGDACHPTTPNNGQGACMAIEDALVLATLLGEFWGKPDGHIEAFYQYERARRAHTTRVQGESLMQMKMGQVTSRAGVWLRDLVISSLPAFVLQKKLRAANMFDMDPWLVRFRALKAKKRQQES